MKDEVFATHPSLKMAAIGEHASSELVSNKTTKSKVFSALVVIVVVFVAAIGIEHYAVPRSSLQGSTFHQLGDHQVSGRQRHIASSEDSGASIAWKSSFFVHIEKEMEGNSDWNALFGSSEQASTLLTVTTSNIWGKTQLLISSLWTVRDRFDLLVVDEGSTDGTLAYLAKYNITVLEVPDVKGLVSNCPLIAVAHLHGCWMLTYQCSTACFHSLCCRACVCVTSGEVVKLPVIIVSRHPSSCATDT